VDTTRPGTVALGLGSYGSTEALRLINYQRADIARATDTERRNVTRITVARWLYGYKHRGSFSKPLWQPDYTPTEDEPGLEVSFRDLIELRFVKTFRDLHLSLQTIRQCFERAAEMVDDQRPFSTQKFRTDGRTLFFEIIDGIQEGQLVDLKRRQNVFHRMVGPSLLDLEFDAAVLARWFPLGKLHRSVVVDPARAFGRPIVSDGGVPTETITQAVKNEGSAERVARLYELPLAAVRDAIAFQRQLAA